MKHFLGLISRCKDELYVKEFVNYYLNEGVEKIFIIDDNSKDKNIYKDVINNNKVKIFYDKDIIKKNSIFHLYKNIRNNFEWLIYVDLDEFITTKKNINNTICDELKTTFKDSICIKIPWVMMSCNSIQENPVSLLKTNVYRWNHDNKHINKKTNEPKFRCRYDKIEVKCIFKPAFFKKIADHHPYQIIKHPRPIFLKSRIVESIKKTKYTLNPYFENLREKDINEGFLLCYHYRLISVQHCLNKIESNIWYKKYTLEDLLSNDCPELIDETIKNKFEKINN